MLVTMQDSDQRQKLCRITRSKSNDDASAFPSVSRGENQAWENLNLDNGHKPAGTLSSRRETLFFYGKNLAPCSRGRHNLNIPKVVLNYTNNLKDGLEIQY